MGYLLVAFQVTVAALLILGGHSVAKKLSKLRDPLQVWDGLNNVGFIPPRLRGWLFSAILGFANPYSRSINFRITELRKGKVCGVMKETKSNSNPFRSVHAAALVAFGETVGGLAAFTLLGKKDRIILTNINAEYVKIARGLLTASSVVTPFKDRATKQLVNEVLIKNAAFETVAKLTLTWAADLKDE